MLSTLARLLRLDTKSSLANPPPELLALLGATPTVSGLSINPQTAMRCCVVHGCVKIIAESVAQLPLHLYRRTSDGGKERATEHPLYELLHDQANDWTSSFEFRRDMMTALCLHPGVFAFVNRIGGKVAELVQIPSEAVVVELDAITQEPRYRVTSSDGTTRVYDRTDILHLSPIGGVAPIELAKEAIGLSLTMEQHGARLFSAGARPSGIFKYAKTLGPEALKRLRDSFNSANAGGANSGRTLVLEDGMEFEPVQFTSVDLQFLELRRHQIAEIARVFRVPLHMLQELERTTHNNAEHMGRQFVSLTLLPWLKLWEGAIRRSLLTTEERRDHFAEFLVDDLQRADLAARFEAYSKAVTNGCSARTRSGLPRTARPMPAATPSACR